MPIVWKKNKATSSITVFAAKKVSLNSVFYDNGMSCPFVNATGT